MEGMVDLLDGNKKLIRHLGDVGGPCLELVAAVTSFNTAFLIDLGHGDGRKRQVVVETAGFGLVSSRAAMS